MKLVRLFTIFEAPDLNRQAEVPAKKRRGFKSSDKYKDAKHQTPDQAKAFDDKLSQFLAPKKSLDDFPDDDEDDFDDVGDEPAWNDDAETDKGFGDEPAAPAAPEKEPDKAIPFASKSEPPSKAMHGGKTAGNVKGDKDTLKALSKALNAVRTSDDDLQDWIDDVIREIERAVRSGSDLSLPKFEATPDDLRDTGGSDEDEEF